MKKENNTISVILSVLFGVAALCFIVLTVITAVGNNNGSSDNLEAAVNYVLSDSVEVNALGNTLEGIVTDDMKNTVYPDGILEELKPAYAINNNLRGWLSIPGTEIDTPIVQGKDNDYYLVRNFYDRVTNTESPNYGNPFLDYRCRKDGELSKNTIIHAHTTGQSDHIPKQAFRSLYDYQDKQHFIDCPTIKYSTLTQDFTFKICAVFYSTTQEAADNGYFFNYIYPDMSDSNMVGYIEQVNERKLYETGVDLQPTDRIITLSTCIYVYGSYDTRLVVVGRLLRDGESEEINPSLVKDNPDYRRPAFWYRSKGQQNPYADSPRWMPDAQ